MLHASSRTAKVAGVAALAGLMMAVAIVAAIKPPPPPAQITTAERESQHGSRLAREMYRCAALTMPDSGCEAAWAENRRRFFRQAEIAPSEHEDGNIASTDKAIAP